MERNAKKGALAAYLRVKKTVSFRVACVVRRSEKMTYANTAFVPMEKKRIVGNPDPDDGEFWVFL